MEPKKEQENQQDFIPKQNPTFLYIMAAFIAVVAAIILVVDGKKIKEANANPDTPAVVVEAAPADSSVVL